MTGRVIRRDRKALSREENRVMEKHLYSLLAVFPTPNIEETAKYYNEVMGFRIVRYTGVKEPHICLYRGSTEIVLTQANSNKVFPMLLV
jgi:hypothetical protein